MGSYQGRGAARAVADLAEGTILATVEIAAPAARVFHALASAEIVKWWGRPGVFEAREWVGEVRPGGQWRASGLDGSGKGWVLEGEFLEVDPPHRLSHTWNAPGASTPPSIVSYRLDSIDGGTRVTLRHSGVRSAEECAGACAGWEACLMGLGRMLGTLHE